MQKSILISIFLLLIIACSKPANESGNDTDTEDSDQYYNIILNNDRLVYRDTNLDSPIVEILLKGENVQVKDENNWFKLKFLNGYILKTQPTPSSTGAQNIHYKKVALYIPQRGRSDFNIVKIADKYSLTLDSANGVKVLERIEKLEKKDFDIPARLPPLTFYDSSIGFFDLMREFQKQGIIYEKSNNMILPYFWPHQLTKAFKANTLALETTSILDKISIANNQYLYIKSDTIFKLNRTRKIINKIPLDEQLAEIREDNPCGRISIFTHVYSPVIIIAVGSRESCSDNPHSTLYFLNGNATVLHKYQEKNKKIKEIYYSEDGQKLFVRFIDFKYEASPQQVCMIFSNTGKITFRKETRLQDVVIYDRSLENQFKFDYKKLVIQPIVDTDVLIEKETQIQEPSKWFFNAGENTLLVSRGNQLYVFGANTSTIYPSFELPTTYRFLSTSSGRYCLLIKHAEKGKARWFVIDLANHRICTRYYVGEIFSQYPKKLIAFAKNSNYFLIDDKNPTTYLVYGDDSGNLSRTELFDRPHMIKEINFKQGSLVQIITEDKTYYVPITDIIRNSRSIEL